jgi:hypothetical protein
LKPLRKRKRSSAQRYKFHSRKDRLICDFENEGIFLNFNFMKFHYMKIPSVLAIASLIFIGGCVLGSISVGDLERMADAFVGRSVTVNGQLLFACPNSSGTSYPEKCIAEVCDIRGTYCLDMHVDSNYGMRQVLDMGSKANVSVTGYLAKKECPANDNSCSPSYYIQVTDVKVIK